MFIWEFAADNVMGQLLQWFYGQLIGFLGNFFEEMNNMGAELFDLPWVEAVTTFFSYLAWALFVVGLIVAVFELAIEYQNGRGSVRETALNIIKAFMAVSLFTIVPVELYKLAVSLQGTFAMAITGSSATIGDVAKSILSQISDINILEPNTTGTIWGFAKITSPIMILLTVIMMAYSVLKVFFANLKRGGIILIQIAFGSLYMFSMPRGYLDGFVGWCKQIIGICMTAFLQSIILLAGLMVLSQHALLGLGLMLSATEIPRIAGSFGVDTSTKANMIGAVYAAQTAVNTTRNVIQTIVK